MEEEQLIRTIKCCLIFNKYFNYNLDILYFHHSFDLSETSISFAIFIQNENPWIECFMLFNVLHK